MPCPKGLFPCYSLCMLTSKESLLYPGESAKQFFLPFVIIIGGFSLLTAIIYGLAGENPVGPVTWFISESWNELSPLVLFLVAVWWCHLTSYILVGSFVQNLRKIGRTAERITRSFLCGLFRTWAAPTPFGNIPASLSLVPLFSRNTPPWLAFGWQAGSSAQLE